MLRRTIPAALALLMVAAAVAPASDWPTFRHDNHRSGKTPERIVAGSLVQAWVWRSPHPPQPAWAGPAKWDAFAGIRGLRSMRNYDPVFHVTAADGLVYFGSSSDDSVRCLDAATGKVKWIYTTDGPVRIAPTIVDQRVYFGSDDGRAYCLEADTGKLVWQYGLAADGKRVLNNGRMIPLWPCRTGVLVDKGTAYFAVGMLPWKESHLCAVDASTGEPDGPGRYIRKRSGQSLEGAMLASADQLFVPQGRIPPVQFDLATGQLRGSLEGGGGCFVLLTDDAHVLHGPGNKTGWISDSNAQTRQRLAAFPGGNAMVVHASVAYLLTDNRLAAMDRATRKAKWSKPCEYPYELILAGDVLFAGGADRVAAFRARDGELLWEGDVEGRVYGLAVAGGRLLVSTDEGAVYCFLPGKEPARQADKESEAKENTPLLPLDPVVAINDKDLIGRWVFQRNAMKDTTVKDLAGKLDGQIAGPIKLQQVDRVEALVTDGGSNRILLTDDHVTANLPGKTISAEAWVRIDQPTAWGGIVGAVQDNGDYERGWLLGYNGSRFSFAISAKNGPGKLTYLAAASDFQNGQWYHVVGTYDGSEQRIYVNGQLAAASTAQQGEIDYPPKAFYEIGAYHDNDEDFRLTGMIHEVRVYSRALTATEVREHHRSKRLKTPPVPEAAKTITLAMGPYLQFTGPDTAVVRWETAEPSPTILEYGAGAQRRAARDDRPKTSHEACLTGLRKNHVYEYAVKVEVDGKELPTEQFECDTFFNYSSGTLHSSSRPPSKDDSTAGIAKEILSTTGVSRGICLLLGAGDGQLAFQLAAQSQLRVIAVDTDARAVTAARQMLHQAGAYGARVCVHQVDSLTELPFVGGFANLVVSDRIASASDCEHLAKPGRGVVCLLDNGKCQSTVRAAIAKAGVWSHQYGLADNSSYGGESLQGAGNADRLRVQWLGRPGPRAQADRNGRKPSPLSTGGRLFMQGLHRVIALDAHNGSILWSLELPHFERFNMPRDCSNWCADEEHVYAATLDRCWQIDAVDGNVSKTHRVLPGPRQDWEYDWGYIASQGDRLIGSSVKRGTSWTNFWGGGGAGWYDSSGGEVTYKICSDRLFSLGKESGATQWTYDGLIINPTITIADGRVCFVECRNQEVIASESRRVGMTELWQDQFLVALDVTTGKKLWQQPIDTADGNVVFYMAAGNGKLVVVACDKQYYVYAFDASDGSAAWDVHYAWPGADHGKHMSRPAIGSGKVFVRPRVINLADGELLDGTMPDGGCGTYALTDRLVIFRAGSVTLWDHTSNDKTAFARLRPGCWLSTIPAAGMLLSPEAGGGCSCGNWLETSMGFWPLSAAGNGRPTSVGRK